MRVVLGSGGRSPHKTRPNGDLKYVQPAVHFEAKPFKIKYEFLRQHFQELIMSLVLVKPRSSFPNQLFA